MMKSLKLGIFLLLNFFMFNSLGAPLIQEGSCHGLQCGQVGRLSLSSKGTGKIFKMGLDTTSEMLDLKHEANKALDGDKFPLKFKMGNGVTSGIEAEIDNVHFDSLKMGKSKVDVDGDEVHVCVPVDEMDIKVDAALDIYGTKISQKGASASVKKSAPQKPEVCFKGKMGADGEVGNLVHIDADEPQDIATETKLAMLDMDLNKASEDEILFNYMTLYFMEENMPLPTKVDWDKIWAVMNKVTPETVKDFFDVGKMRQELKKIKGSLPIGDSDEKKTGLKNYIGSLEVDLNLKQNQTNMKKDKKFWEEAYDIWIGKNEKPPEKKPKPDSQNLWGMFEDMASNVVDGAKRAFNRTAKAAGRISQGVANNIGLNAETIMRERFLPYLQESFNKNATTSAPVMTAIAKAAEKKLIPLAKEKANKAIANFQNGVFKDGIYRTTMKEPVFNAQDLVDHNTLRRMEEKISPEKILNLVKQSKTPIRNKDKKEKFEKDVSGLLMNAQKYLQAISDDSSDKRSLEFLNDKLNGALQAVGHIFNGPNKHLLDEELKTQYHQLLRLRRAKAAFVRENIAARERNYNLEFSANFFSKLSGGPEVTLAVPELCHEVSTLPASQVLKPEDFKKHDINAAVGTDAINAIIKKKAENGEFDFCLYDNEARTCSSKGDNYDNKCQFTESPQLVWNKESKKHEIHLKKISCDTRLVNADPECGADSKVDIPVLGFIINTAAKAAGSVCKFIGDQADEFVQGSVGQNLVDVVVEVEPKVCGNSVCIEPNLKDTNVIHNLEKVNPSLVGLVGKIVGTVASPITDIVKTEIVDDALMVFMQNQVGRPIDAPVGIAPKKIVSEEGRITILSDIDEGHDLKSAVDACIKDSSNCADNLY